MHYCSVYPVKLRVQGVLMMDANVKHFYDEGYNSELNTYNPYNRKSQILPFHAWQAGFYDKHGRMPREFIFRGQDDE